MTSKNLMRVAAAVLATGAMMFPGPGALAGISPPQIQPGADIRLIAGGCGPDRHRLLGGGCSLPPYNKTQREYLQDLRPCQPGTHSESFPSPQGYRCVLNR